MAYRNDIPYFQIDLRFFQEFDRGENISQFLPSQWELKPDDIVEWEAGSNIYGTARVVEVKSGKLERNDFVTLVKLS